MNWIYICKSVHVIGFVSWFAGLFFLVRLFVYHLEAFAKPADEARLFAAHFGQMEQRVYRIIANPAMMLTWLAGLAMLALDLSGVVARGYFTTGTTGWMPLKLVLLLLLSGYHLRCKRMIDQLAHGERPFSPWQMRLFNEVPTFFLAAITFTVVFGKDGRLNYGYLALGLVIFSWLVYRGAVAYRNRRAAEQ